MIMIVVLKRVIMRFGYISLWTCVESLLIMLSVIGEIIAQEETWNTPAPDFLQTPSNVTYHSGELAVLRCSVFNLGTKTVVWRRLDSSFPITSGTMTVVADDRFQIGHVDYKNQWDLMIKNVQVEDEGIYECQVASKDKTSRRLVQLTVIDPELEEPEIQISGPQFVERGEQIFLQCNATGEYYPPDEMDWFKNGQRLTSRRHNGVKITKQYSLLKRTFTSSLTIDRASMDDDGTYVCRSSDMQITSTKVHVLNGKENTLNVERNAETFNKKRGTVNTSEEENAPYSSDIGQKENIKPTSGVLRLTVSFLHTVFFVLSTLCYH